MVVKSRRLQAVVEERGHHRVDLVLRQHEIAHHHVHAAGTLRHRHPAAETEWGRGFHIRHGDAEVVARNVDLEDVGLVVALLAQHRQDLLVVGRNLLRHCD